MTDKAEQAAERLREAQAKVERASNPQPPSSVEQILSMVKANPASMMLDERAGQSIMRYAITLSKSSIVPYRARKGKPMEGSFRDNPSNCFVACNLAVLLGVDPIMLMQNITVIHGRPGMQAKLKIGLANMRGPFKAPINWTETGEGRSREWTAYAIHRETGERYEQTVTWAMVEAEGWNKSKGDTPSKWMTIPSQMGRYRSASFLIDLVCPEVVLGLPAVEDLEDIAPEGETIAVVTKKGFERIAEDPDIIDAQLVEPNLPTDPTQDTEGAGHLDDPDAKDPFAAPGEDDIPESVVNVPPAKAEPAEKDHPALQAAIRLWGDEVPPPEMGAMMEKIGIKSGDRRTQTAQRIADFDTACGEWVQGGRE
jgi:hypothetical protein